MKHAGFQRMKVHRTPKYAADGEGEIGHQSQRGLLPTHFFSLFFRVWLSLAIQVCLVSANSRRTNYHDFLVGCDGHFLASM